MHHARKLHLDRDYDASDPYDQVAVIYRVFMCEICNAFYDGNPPIKQSLPYHVVGQGARIAGWLVESLGFDWRVLCPACRTRGPQT
jgi:hypothetical protein